MAKQSIYTDGGTVQAGSGLYISRKVDEDLLTLCRDSTFAYILTSRQMGKSSLMVRTAERLTHGGIRSVILDLTQIGVQVSAEEWYLGLLTMIDDLMEIDLGSWWQVHAGLGVTQRLTKFFQEVLLDKVAGPVVIFVDEIDTTLSLSFTDDFFAAIRYLYNARATILDFQRLSFVLIGVATPSDLIRDPQRTPFNIGQRVDLTDFTHEEAIPLADGLLRPPSDEARQVLRWVMKWTGGHPYLTQRLCRVIADQNRDHCLESDVDDAVASSFFGEMSEQDHNLQFVRDMLTKRAPDLGSVLATYRKIRLGWSPVRDEEQSLVKSHLKLSGVVRRDNSELRVRNPIYEEVFDLRWVKEHRPVNWKRRVQRATIFLSASIVVAAFVFVLLFARAHQQLAESQRQLAEQAQTSAIQQQGLAEAEAKARAEAEVRRKEAEMAREEAHAARQRAEQQAQLALSRALAAAALNNLNIDPERSVLLALRAVSVTYSAEAEDALRRAVQASRVRLTLSGHTGSVEGIAFSPDGTRLATASGDRTAKVWDAASGRELLTLSGHTGEVSGITFSPDGTHLATASGDQTAKVWDAASGRELLTLSSHTGKIWDIAFSPDGTHLATASGDRTAKVWDAASGRELLTLSGHTGEVSGITFSPDGTHLATASGDQTAKVWDAASGRELLTLSSHTGKIWDIAFSPDGTRLATASEDRTAKVWDAASGRELLTLSGHTGRVGGIAFSPDGTHLATASEDRTARVNTLDIEDPAALARLRVTRSLTPEECQKYLPGQQCPPTP